jgi:hypothetical protein
LKSFFHVQLILVKKSFTIVVELIYIPTQYFGFLIKNCAGVCSLFSSIIFSQSIAVNDGFLPHL